MMTLVGGNEIVLKEFIQDDKDFPQYLTWLREWDNIKTIGRYEYLLTMDINETKAYVDELNRSKNDSFFKVYENDVFIGTFKIGHIDWRLGIADVGIMIGSTEHKGRGLSKQIINVGIEYAFQTLGLRKLRGGCFSSNIVACKMFEGCGFIEEGRLRKELMLDGQYCDHVLYGLLKDDI